MIKRILPLLLAGVLGISATGCGKQESLECMTGDKCCTLSVSVWDENFNVPALRAAEKDYQQVNPNFKLDIVLKENSDAIEDEIQEAKETADFSNLTDIVLFQDHSIQKYVKENRNAFITANDAIVDWNNLGKEKISYSIVEGRHYGFPVDAGTAIFAYRIDILEECGYTLGDLTNISWDKFDRIGKDIYSKTGKYLISAVGKDNDLISMMLQAEGESEFKGEEPFIVNNNKLQQVVETIVKLEQDNVLYLAEDWDDYVDNAIGNDMVAGVYDGNWIISSIEKNEANSGKWEITTAPTMSGNPGYATNGGSSLLITSNCSNPLLAKDFLSYTFGGASAIDGESITYDEALKNAGLVGTCVAASRSDIYSQEVEYFNNQKIYEMIVEYSQNVSSVEQSDYYYTCRTIMSEVVLDMINNGTDIETAFENAQLELEKEMGIEE